MICENLLRYVGLNPNHSPHIPLLLLSRRLRERTTAGDQPNNVLTPTPPGGSQGNERRRSTSTNPLSNSNDKENDSPLPKYKRDLVQKMKVLRQELQAMQPQAGHCRLEVSREEIFEVKYYLLEAYVALFVHLPLSVVIVGILSSNHENETEGSKKEVDGEVSWRGRLGLWRGGQVASLIPVSCDSGLLHM